MVCPVFTTNPLPSAIIIFPDAGFLYFKTNFDSWILKRRKYVQPHKCTHHGIFHLCVWRLMLHPAPAEGDLCPLNIYFCGRSKHGARKRNSKPHQSHCKDTVNFQKKQKMDKEVPQKSISASFLPASSFRFNIMQYSLLSTKKVALSPLFK